MNTFIVKCGIFAFMMFAYSATTLSSDRIDGTNNQTLEIHTNLIPNHVIGARLYDDFVAEDTGNIFFPINTMNELVTIGTPIDPNLPIPAPEESYKCSYCHGYDYRGGIYSYENGKTNNLIEIRNNRGLTLDGVYKVLLSGFNMFNGTTHINVHNYNGILSVQEMVDIADFIANEMVDVNRFISEATNESKYNHMPSMFIYGNNPDPALRTFPAATRINGNRFYCVDCHGPKGRALPGIDLYVLAWTQPYKWLHRTNFGTPRSQRTYPNIDLEDATIHPGLYEVALVDSLKYGSAINAAELLEYVQTHFDPVP